MRQIRRAEALVAQSILAGDAIRSRPLRIPRRTRQTVTRRLYGWNWFTDREVVSPATLGSPWMTFAVMTPYVDQRRAVERRWQSSAEACVVWSMEGACFGVFASLSSERAAALRGTLEDGASSRNFLFVTLDLRTQEVPIWFDFEGAWCRTMVGGPSLAYPISLPRVPEVREEAAGERPSWAEGVAIRRLVARDRSAGSSAPSARQSPVAYSTSEAKVHREGWVARRSFLNPGDVGRTILGFPPRITFLHGYRREVEVDLLPNLLSEGGISPFLLAIAGEQVLLGVMGRGSGEATMDPSRESRPVTSRLVELLESVSVVREPTPSIRVLVDHRYDQLLGAEAASSLALAPRSGSIDTRRVVG